MIPIELGATIKGELGPLQAVVEDIGLRLDLTFPPNRDGNLGVANLALGFKPPNGVGLSIDAGVVKGGGYLFLDPDAGEYAGAIELTVADFLSLKAIGLITTKMPDGSSGFSLLVIITRRVRRRHPARLRVRADRRRRPARPEPDDAPRRR